MSTSKITTEYDELVKSLVFGKVVKFLLFFVFSEEFLNEAQCYIQVTPMEIDMLFALASGLRLDGKISRKELEKIAPIQEERMSYTIQAKAVQVIIFIRCPIFHFLCWIILRIRMILS